MKSGLKVRKDNAESVLSSLRALSKMDVLVGIPEANATRKEGETLNNAEIGYLQSTGATIQIGSQTVTLEPRPFLDMGIEDSQEITTGHLKAAAELALEGKQDAAKRELEKAGMVARDAAKKVIGDGDRLHPLSEKTLENRRAQGIPGEKPLYAHGFLLRSITYVVRSK
ncbi:TPA: hypothetical protein ACQQX6_000633 [Yersinia enterocolitica]|uniref:hypothetical protein n=1 Tax=Yersinia TaxID=629 RepID=UPI0005E173C3|nr:hypothetical protein [Yersinia rohdei]EKN6273226.1 hypothetical protein [Yersinia enterocolitica]EKN6282893.1 hypothetical protein [Yersinia enterocolitica]CNJ29943.1 Uncharacterised protein [Yersinia rohdei]HDL6520294.1 hypothetical protein [Yersinia enterocolitica]HDL7179735.1 hypothetical protein [Yersinia enterocolitica]